MNVYAPGKPGLEPMRMRPFFSPVSSVRATSREIAEREWGKTVSELEKGVDGAYMSLQSACVDTYIRYSDTSVMT